MGGLDVFPKHNTSLQFWMAAALLAKNMKPALSIPARKLFLAEALLHTGGEMLFADDRNHRAAMSDTEIASVFYTCPVCTFEI